MSQTVNEFVHQVLAVTSPLTDIGGGVIPAFEGVSNTKSNATDQLHQAVVRFGHSYHDPQVTVGQLQQQADEVEGHLLAEISVDVLTEATGLALIDELHSLMATRTN